MTLSSFQLKNPFKQASKDFSLTYIERSFRNADLEEMEQWAETGVVARIMAGQTRTSVPYFEWLPLLFLQGATKAKLADTIVEAWWGRLWKMGGKDHSEHFDKWLLQAAGKFDGISDALVSAGANPFQTNYIRQAHDRTPMGQLMDALEEALSGKEDRAPDQSHGIAARLDTWMEIGQPTQKTLDGLLEKVTRHFLASDNPIEPWAKLRDALLLKGAFPYEKSMDTLLNHISLAKNYEMSYAERARLFPMGDKYNARKQEQLDQQREAHTQERRAFKLDRASQWANGLTRATPGISHGDHSWDNLYQWEGLLSFDGGEQAIIQIMKQGGTPWNLRASAAGLGNRGTSTTSSVLLDYSGKRNHEALARLAKLAQFAEPPDSKWIDGAALPYLMAAKTPPPRDSKPNAPHLEDIQPADFRHLMTLCSWSENDGQLRRGAEAWFRRQLPETNADYLRSTLHELQSLGVLPYILRAPLGEKQYSDTDLSMTRNKLEKWIKDPVMFQILLDTAPDQASRLHGFNALLSLGMEEAPEIEAKIKQAIALDPEIAPRLVAKALDDFRYGGLSLGNAIQSILANSGTLVLDKEEQHAFLGDCLVRITGFTRNEGRRLPALDLVRTTRLVCQMAGEGSAQFLLESLVNLEANTHKSRAHPFADLIPMAMTLLEIGGDIRHLAPVAEGPARPISELIQAEQFRLSMNESVAPAPRSGKAARL